MQGSRRLLSGVGAAAIVAASLVACSAQTPTAPAEEVPTTSDEVNGEIDTSQVKKDLVVGVDNPYYLFHEDILMADKLGYFEEYGIDNVKIVTSDDPLPGLIGGSLDFMLYDTDTAIAAAAKGGDIRYLSVYLGGEANILGVRPGIETADDLKGATITGGQFGSRNDFLLRKLLTDNGLDPDTDVKIVSTGGQSNERLQAIIAGTVDGSTLQIRHRSLLEAEGGKFLFQELTTAPQNGFSVNGKLLRESPETPAAFLAAVLKARAYIEDPANKQEVLDYVESLDFELPQAYKDVYEDENAPTYHTGDGGFETADMDQFVDEQIGFDIIAAGTDWHDYVDLVPLWRAQKALGLPLRPAPEDLAE